MLECSSGYINLTPSKWAEKDDRLVAMTRYIHKHIKRALSVECVTIGIRQLNLISSAMTLTLTLIPLYFLVTNKVNSLIPSRPQ